MLNKYSLTACASENLVYAWGSEIEALLTGRLDKFGTNDISEDDTVKKISKLKSPILSGLGKVDARVLKEYKAELTFPFS